MRRILIDECINPRLSTRLRSIIGPDLIQTVRELGWAGTRDAIIVDKMGQDYDVFVTIDQGFEHQHDLHKVGFAIVILHAQNNQMPSYERLLGDLIPALENTPPGQVLHVRDPLL